MTGIGRAVGSEGERTLETHLRNLGIAFVREHRFVPGRKYKADFFIGKLKGSALYGDLLVEIDGGAWAKDSRHRSGAGFTRDCEKSALAAINGYRVIHCTTEQVESGECAGWVEAAIR